MIGDDFPQDVLDTMKNRGISLDGLQIKEGEKSFFWSGKYHYDMNTRDTLVTDLNVLADFDPIIPDSYQDTSFLMLGNLAPAVQKAVQTRLTNKPDLVVLDTMNFWMDNTWDELLEVIGKCDVLTINDEEARQLSNEHSPRKSGS